MSEIQIGGQSEEEYFLGYDKFVSTTYSNNHDDLPGNSSDKDVSHEYMRKKETQKYLRESCYHRIKCTAVTFLAAFMWRRPLNSTTLAITTHRKAKEGVRWDRYLSKGLDGLQVQDQDGPMRAI